MILTIRRKILLAFLAVCMITEALGLYAAHGIAVTGGLVVETFDQALMSINYARAAAADFAAMEAVLARRALAAGDPRRQAELDARDNDLAAALSDDLAIAAARALSPRVEQATKDVSDAVARWRAAGKRAPGQPNGAAFWRDVDALQATVDDEFDVLVNLVAGEGFRHREQALADITLIRVLSIVALAGALVMSAGVAVALARRIMEPVQAASAAAAAIAAGHLATPIPGAGGDELGQLLAAMEAMRDAIRAMMEREVAQRRSAQARLADALDTSREGVMLIDPSGRVAMANRRLADFFPALAPHLAPGVPIARLLGRALARDLIASEDEGGSTGGRRALRAPLLALGVAPTEMRLASGVWLRIGGSATADGGMVAICSDITALKQREADLEQVNFCLDAALNNMIQGLCLYGPDQALRLANRRFGEMFQVADDSLLAPGTRLDAVLRATLARGGDADGDLAALEDEVRATLARGTATRAARTLAGGRVVETSWVPLADGGWVVTYEDITERTQTEEEIRFLARHDPLTRLPNRAQLAERLELAIAELGRGAGFALMSLDLDRFKPVNDTLGRGVGDLLLRAVAERLSFCVRETDLVARVGGDEFAIVQTEIERPEQIGLLAQRLLAAMANPFEIDGHRVSVGISIGIALAPQDGQQAEILLKNADTARYRAKLEGRGGYRSFDAAMDARLQARRAMELELRQALADDQFELYYQPLVDLATGRVTGFESLVRWRHPARGMVPPGEFIQVAEEIGLIVPLGQWIIRAACAEAATWPEPVRVAVNVSPLQFRDPHLVEVVVGALAQSGIPARRLELEITESVLLADGEATLEVLRRLRALGVRISMDDFGTGYSSLSYLRSFPFDKIKIDQSFVRGMKPGTDAAVIVGAIAGLGRNLGMRTLAEGVETAEELDLLRATGCHEVQGYYFSRPRPAGEVAALIARINHDGRADDAALVTRIA